MTFIPSSGLLGGAVAPGGPAALVMGSLVVGVLAATTLALVLGAERKALRRNPAITLRPPSADDRAAAA